MNKYVRKGLKIFLWTITSILLLVVALALSLNIPAVQNFVKDRVISYLKKKTHTEISLQSIKIAFPKDVVLNKFYIEDLKKDTLLYADKLAVDISLLKLLNNTVEINNIELNKIRANVTRITPDTTFNFSFLVDAFMTEQKKPQEKVKEDTTSTLKFSINKIALQDIGITYRDDVAGNDMRLHLGELETKIKDFDLTNQHYVIKTFDLKNTSLTYLQQKPLTHLVQHITNTVDSSQKEEGRLPLVEVEEFLFSNVKIKYDDQLATTKAVLNLADLGLSNTKIDLTHNKYQVNDAHLNNSSILFAFKPAPANDLNKVKDTVLVESSPMAILVNNISLENNAVQFDNLAAKPLPKGMDFNHLKITKLNLGANNIRYDAKGILATVKNGSLNEKSGFILNDLKAAVTYTDKQIRVRDFLFNTPNTYIENNTNLTFNSIEDLTKHPEKVKIQLDLKNTTIGLKDASFFSDAVPAAYRNEKIKVNASVKGYLNNLNIPQLQITGLKNTHIALEGTIKGLPTIEKTYLDINIQKLATSKRDLLVLVPSSALPTSIELPNQINATGYFKGTMSTFKTNLNVKTDMGNAALLASLSGAKGKEKYQGNVNIQNFNVGRLLKMQPNLGRVTIKANVSGTGLEPKKINAKFNAKLISAYYNKYTYRNLNLQGSYANQRVNLKGNMTDSNANFNLNARVNMAGKYPAVNAQLNLKRLDLQALNFYARTLQAAGKVHVNLPTADIDYLNGNVDVTGLQLVMNNELINVDTLFLHAKTTATASSLKLKSEILSANLEGNYQLSKLGATLINELNKYYAFGQVTPVPDQRLKFGIQIYDSKLLKKFVPELTVFKPAQINGLIDTKQDSLLLKGSFPQVVYGDYRIDSIALSVENKTTNELGYDFNVKSLQSPSISLFNTEISGTAANNNLNVNIFLRDKELKDKYVIAGLFQSINKDFRFNLDPQKLILDYEKWTVSPENYIQFGQSGILINQFQLSNSGQSLSINSTPSTPNAPLAIEFKDFQLATLTKFADTDTTLVGGKLNGTATVMDLAQTPKFEANLSIEGLRYQKDELGTLRLVANNHTENAFEINAALSGVHELRVNGFYYTEPNSALDLKLNIDKIELKNIESLSAGQLKEGKGTISGELTLKGSLTEPRILGDINFNDAGARIAYVNSYFRLPSEKISFTEEGIRFNNFTLIDSLNQKATINGMVYTSNFSDFKFGLDIRTNNFRALNSTAVDNELFYGTVFLTSNIKIRGDLNQPDVNMSVRINKGTNFFFVVPASDPSVIDQEGIVQFVDEDAPPFNGEKALNVDSVTKSPLKGINLVADIAIDPEADLNIIVDPLNGDNLKIKGEANLNAGIDPSGKISLTGRYEVLTGAYKLTIPGLGQKEFQIEKGSTIIWTGEPMEANVNITAMHEVNAAPIDLLNQPDRVEAKTKLPFQVYLYMKGELLKPKISFKIELPENERNALGGDVETKLNNVNRNESELNKQVFALLALGRFIANNPFQSLASTSTSAIARQSVSKLLTEQLNNLASDLIQGVELNIGVNSSEDYSSGSAQQKTDLEIGLSKKLLNDRLTVTVGSSFGLEGSQPADKNANNIAGNVNVEYALSADGRYRLRGYRRNQNESVIEGQIIETGLGFTLVMDYNKFKEIFEQRRSRKRFREEQKFKNETTN
ncbi:translocation/assembly module TamB domain-containing protein [Pedobacter sp. MW01-1-1]|uniref:translocation/assembly module TamB domain-containing protein n=1 Tax=Pedobacter sp. MW01-1-1 TaxID=3383027 RepID=UPI003FF1578E